jgi:hypothetical protein
MHGWMSLKLILVRRKLKFWRMIFLIIGQVFKNYLNFKQYIQTINLSHNRIKNLSDKLFGSHIEKSLTTMSFAYNEISKI